MIIWKILHVSVIPELDGKTDVVCNVGWRAVLEKEINGKTYVTGKYNRLDLGAPGETFIQYNDLTEEEVLNWIWANGVDKAAVENELNSASVFTIKDAMPAPWIPPHKN